MLASAARGVAANDNVPLQTGSVENSAKLLIFPVGTTQIAALSRGTTALYRHVKTEEESGSVPPRSDLAP